MNKRKTAQKCHIYWDYENCPIPFKSSSLGTVYGVIKRKIYASLHQEVPVKTNLYYAKKFKMNKKLERDIEVNGITPCVCPSLKTDAVDKRMLVDVALHLYDWKGIQCNAVVLISGDSDFGNILAKIHKLPEIAKLIFMRLPKDDGTYNPINPNLKANVDDIIEDFNVKQFIDCRNGKFCQNISQCSFYHHQSDYDKLQNHVSSVSNIDEKKQDIGTSTGNGRWIARGKVNDKTLEIRNKIPCRDKNDCDRWKNGNCHFFHESPYVPHQQQLDEQYAQQQQQLQMQRMQQMQHIAANTTECGRERGRGKGRGRGKVNDKTLEIRNKIPCRDRNNCARWKNGNCHFFHESPYVPHQQQLAQLQIQQMQQQQQPYISQVRGTQPIEDNVQSVVITYENLICGQFEDADVDTSKKEQYLSDQEFITVFEMTKNKFQALAAWKQKRLKKEKKLF